MNRVRKKRAGIAIAIALVSSACVKVPDSIKATFAPHGASEVDNFSASSPHSSAPPPDVELTQAVVAGPDASAAPSPAEGMCSRDATTSDATSADAGSALSSTTSVPSRNCLQDAGNP